MQPKSTVFAARNMVRKALKGALATRDEVTGVPYASMILLATTVSGDPLSIVSRLARHTQNLLASSAASILIDTSNAQGDAASGGRISLQGRFTKDISVSARSRFLARHAGARAYADFADFAIMRLEIENAHLIEGFGRIVSLSGDKLRAPLADDTGFQEAEADALAALRLCWPEVTGLDAEGVDLIVGGSSQRLPFPTAASDMQQARKAAANCLATRGDVASA